MNAQGERRDFYATRHTAISRIVRAVRVNAGQEHARHSTSRRTLDVYSHIDGADRAKSVAALPFVPMTRAALALQSGVKSGSNLSKTDGGASAVVAVKSCGNRP